MRELDHKVPNLVERTLIELPRDERKQVTERARRSHLIADARRFDRRAHCRANLSRHRDGRQPLTSARSPSLEVSRRGNPWLREAGTKAARDKRCERDLTIAAKRGPSRVCGERAKPELRSRQRERWRLPDHSRNLGIPEAPGYIHETNATGP